MKGIDYIVDEKGRRRAAVVDLEQWGKEWEDFCDGLTSLMRRNEPRVKWEDLKKEMDKASALAGVK